jgi:predicted deacylase
MQIQQLKLELSNDIAGNSIGINGITLKNGTGPKVYIQGGTHGGELTYFIIERLYNNLIESGFKGEITFIPISNPFSWNQRMYFYTTGKFSMQTGEDWNRGFPGSDESLNNRRAKKLIDLASGYDYVIDLHTSRRSIPFAIFNEERLESDKEVIKALGFTYNYLISNKIDSSMMSALSTKDDIKAFEIECGSHDSYEEVNIEMVVNAILRLLANVGSIKTRQQKTKSIEQFVFKKFQKYYADESGFLRFVGQLGGQVNAGEALYSINSSSRLFECKEITAINPGILIKQIPTNIVWEGDEVMQIIDLAELQRI